MEGEFRTGVLTLSDKASRGERKDESGRVAAEMLEQEGFAILRQEVRPDDRAQIVDTLKDWVDNAGLSLIVTSGGTGLSPTDVTPQAMEAVIDYLVPGMAEAMRAESLKGPCRELPPGPDGWSRNMGTVPGYGNGPVDAGTSLGPQRSGRVRIFSLYRLPVR